MDSGGKGAPEREQPRADLSSSVEIRLSDKHFRGAYERNIQRLVEDNVTSIETAHCFGRLLPAREVVNQLGRCHQHNFRRWDEALLGQVVPSPFAIFHLL